MSMPKVGDQVRITIEGKVVQVIPPVSYRAGGSTRLVIEREDGKRGTYYHGSGSGTEVEILTPPYEHDGIYIDGDNEIFKFVAHANQGRGGWIEFDRDTGSWNTRTTHGVEYLSAPIQQLV